MTLEVLDIDRALPAMHEVAGRLTPSSWQHPGQVTWSARYALPDDLQHGPVGVFRVDGVAVGWSWVETRAYSPARNIFAVLRAWPKTWFDFAF